MRTFYSLFLMALPFIFCCKKNDTPAPDTPAKPIYELAWKDDFDESSLNLNEWYFRNNGVRHDGFNDETTVAPDGKGNLQIKVYTDTLNGKAVHHAGMIATKKEFKYGKFEARVSFVNESGSWSAFWLQSATMGNPVGNPAVAGMEIDVVETLHNDGRAHQNLHWDGYGKDHKSAGFKTGNVGVNGGDFHIFTVEWTPEFYKFYVDDTLTWTYTGNISQRSEYIILSSEVKNYAAGTWAGPIPAAGFGTKESTKTIMLVDYVKYYALK